MIAKEFNDWTDSVRKAEGVRCGHAQPANETRWPTFPKEALQVFKSARKDIEQGRGIYRNIASWDRDAEEMVDQVLRAVLAGPAGVQGRIDSLNSAIKRLNEELKGGSLDERERFHTKNVVELYTAERDLLALFASGQSIAMRQALRTCEGYPIGKKIALNDLIRIFDRAVNKINGSD